MLVNLLDACMPTRRLEDAKTPTYPFLLVIELFPLGTEQFADFAYVTRPDALSPRSWCGKQKKGIPKLASGFSALILSRQSWLKNMYAESARLGAFGSFLRAPPRGAFSAFSLALRV
jgi:hypothetical protein